MKEIIKLEEAAQFIFSLYILQTLFPLHTWYILIFFLPDAFAVGYFIGPKTGSIFYNLSHHKGISLILIAAGIIGNSKTCLLYGLLFYSHSSFDRMIGYGLKFGDSPNHTHLGYIGKEKYRNDTV
jgi:hypothetical protein